MKKELPLQIRRILFLVVLAFASFNLISAAHATTYLDTRNLFTSTSTPSQDLNVVDPTDGGSNQNSSIKLGTISATIPEFSDYYLNFSAPFPNSCATIVNNLLPSDTAFLTIAYFTSDGGNFLGHDDVVNNDITTLPDGTCVAHFEAFGTWNAGSFAVLQVIHFYGGYLIPSFPLVMTSGGTWTGPLAPYCGLHCRYYNGTLYAQLYSSQQREPVVIIPGIFGSVFKNGQWILQPVFQPYDGLKTTLIDNGYVQNQTLFDFPYDWEHTSIPVLAQQLQNKIQQVKTICGCSKVNLVAHSMGGLIARQYIQSNFYQNDVDQVIFLGTPQLGAAGDYLAWEGGTSGFSGELDFKDIYLKSVIYQEAIEAGFPITVPRDLDIFNYIHSSSSPAFAFQELLPTYDYLRDASNSTLRTYPNGYPENTFLDELNSSSSLTALQQSGVSITTIYSNDQSTTPSIIDVRAESSTAPLWSDGVPQAFEFGAGDGTVLQNSATLINASSAIEIGGAHADLPTTAEGKIVQLLTGIANPVIAPPPSSLQRFLSIFGLSPVNLLITAPDGSKLGTDFSTGQEVNQIPGAFYSGSGANEHVFIPNPEDGQYTIATQGTATGVYHVLTSYGYHTSSSATSSDAIFGGNTQPGLIENLNLTVNSSTPSSNTLIPQDTTPPVILHSALNSQYLLHSTSTQFTYGATDSGVGVFSVTSTLDGVPISSGAPINFNIQGNHMIVITAQDFVGNTTSTTIAYNVAYNFGGFLPPIKADGSGIYNLGRTLPIKFQLTDASGNFVSAAKAQLAVTNVQNGIVGTSPIDLTTSTNDIGNLFRYDSTANQYIYNFDTGQLTSGTWQLKVVLDDGSSDSVIVSLK